MNLARPSSRGDGSMVMVLEVVPGQVKAGHDAVAGRLPIVRTCWFWQHAKCVFFCISPSILLLTNVIMSVLGLGVPFQPSLNYKLNISKLAPSEEARVVRENECNDQNWHEENTKAVFVSTSVFNSKQSWLCLPVWRFALSSFSLLFKPFFCSTPSLQTLFLVTWHWKRERKKSWREDENWSGHGCAHLKDAEHHLSKRRTWRLSLRLSIGFIGLGLSPPATEQTRRTVLKRHLCLKFGVCFFLNAKNVPPSQALRWRQRFQWI